MIEYSYDFNFNPPAPALEVNVCDLLQTQKKQKIKCLLDTGADITVIPNDKIQLLELTPIDVVNVIGYDGKEEYQEVYIAKIFIGNLEFSVEIIGTSEDTGLIGRDILNQLVILLDGKNLRFNIKIE